MSKINATITRKLYDDKLQKNVHKEAADLHKQQIINDTLMLREKQKALDSVMDNFGKAHRVACTWVSTLKK